jgi:hypothetical protein
MEDMEDSLQAAGYRLQAKNENGWRQSIRMLRYVETTALQEKLRNTLSKSHAKRRLTCSL